MFIGIAKIKIYIDDSYSLKDKRQLRYSIIDRLKKRYNISIMEVDDQDIHRSLILGFSYIHLSESLAIEYMKKIELFIEENIDAEILDFYYEIMKFE